MCVCLHIYTYDVNVTYAYAHIYKIISRIFFYLAAYISQFKDMPQQYFYKIHLYNTQYDDFHLCH